jgi:hypothetical protein
MSPMECMVSISLVRLDHFSWVNGFVTQPLDSVILHDVGFNRGLFS